ncbi:MAG: hypothetical protein IAE97_01065 [Chthoniobacterales bacterium]|nr:hypothetical protein [Chthoniobacterales bacterium]
MKPTIPAILLLLVASVFAEDYEMNELPMYGGEHIPEVEQDKANSRAASELGWKHLAKGDLSTAMKRFNQAWMLDRKNPEAFWGFGIVMGRRAAGSDTEENLEESIRLLTKARELNPANGRITGDLAFSHSLLGNLRESQGGDGRENFGKADALFAEAFRMDPKYPPIAANWAVLKFYTGDYKEARKLITEAQALGCTPDPEFLEDLGRKEK